MALFNKLFINRNRDNHNKSQEFIGEKLFAFSKDQVRLVLFRECDFRGRKLLFDSTCIKKVPITSDHQEKEKFTEISNGYGYIYTKPKQDRNQLSEMVFGSVAMSYRGTYFKMHTLETPNRLMFTQVFPSPRHKSQISVSSHNNEHSTNKFTDSSASSSNSVNSNTSDPMLFCRKLNSYSVFDIPNVALSTSHTSTVDDSGYCAENSFSNISSEPSSLGTSLSLSTNSLYKKWLRRTSTSLDNSGFFSSRSSSSTDEEAVKLYQRSTKIGFALIIELTPGRENELCQFFMEHIIIIEAILWRIRRSTEMACVKSHDFVSMMVDTINATTQYLVSLLSGSYLSTNLWLLLSNGCDRFNSISTFSAAISNNNNNNNNNISNNNNNFDELYQRKLTWRQQTDSTLFNFGNLLKYTDWDLFNFKKNLILHEQQRDRTAEKFVQDFCELLETIDVKDTNFFMSTLLTAVLTHHLGWVNTCLPSTTPTPDNNLPFNPLWGELSDLYGAIGHPIKMSQTILTGRGRRDVLTKIQTSLTYFIRCCDVVRRIPNRTNIEEENNVVNVICEQYSCIPKENCKRYEDHLKEIMNNNCEFFNSKTSITPKCSENIEMKIFTKSDKWVEDKFIKKSKNLVKTQTCIKNLAAMLEEEEGEESFISSKLEEKPTSNESEIFYDNSKKSKSKLTHTNSSSSIQQFNNNEDVKSGVVFVLGENEELVGLKKSHSNENIPPKRPNYLNLSTCESKNDCGQFNDSDFIKNKGPSIKPSTSWSSLNITKETCNNSPEKLENQSSCSKSTRAQSVPPEERKFDEEEKVVKSKYRYSGVKKFNLQQYPQILSNYMKSKNLEISNLQFGEKGMKIDELSSISEVISAKYPQVDSEYEEGEALQTPSNASELEFTSDIFVAPSPVKECAKETSVENFSTSFKKQYVPNTVIIKDGGECDKKFLQMCGGQKNDGCNRKTSNNSVNKMKIAHFPMPKSTYETYTEQPINYTSSLLRPPHDNYLPDMVMQAITSSKLDWESNVKNNLALASQHSPIDQPLDEAVAIIGNIDTWEVQLMSSHTFVIDKGSNGVRVGMSQLVSNMLESLLQMWKLNVPPHYCLLHIEQTLQEFCVRSKALAELLLATEFCNMEQVTSMLHLEVNDVPLLLAVASTHSPQVTQKYGLSFQ